MSESFQIYEILSIFCLSESFQIHDILIPWYSYSDPGLERLLTRATVSKSVTPFVHGVTSSIQDVTIEQQQVTLEQHFCGSHTAWKSSYKTWFEPHKFFWPNHDRESSETVLILWILCCANFHEHQDSGVESILPRMQLYTQRCTHNHKWTLGFSTLFKKTK